MENCSNNESSMNISHSNTEYDFDIDLDFNIDLDLDCFNDGVSLYSSSNNGGEGGSFANDHTPMEELLHHHHHYYSHAQPTMLTSTPSTSNPNSQFPPPPFTAVTTASSAQMESPAVSAAHLVPLSHHHIRGLASSAAAVPPFPLGHSAAQIGASPSSVNYTATNTVCQTPYTMLTSTSTPSTSNPSSQFPPPPFTAVTTASSAQMESPAISAAHLVPQSRHHTGGSASSAAAIPPLPLGHSAAQIGASPSSVNFTATNTLCQTPYTVLEIDAAKRNKNGIGLKLSKSVKKTPSCIKMKMKQKQKHQQWERGSSSSSQAAIPNNDLTCTPVKPLKAIRFPAFSLEIGTWKKVAIHDDDLVVKCYFRQSQIVWELLDGKLKAKIEVPWSNILAIKPTFSPNELGILNVMLHEKPSFYQEKNPTPAKHTKWEKSGDFTADSQASLLRVHTFKFDPEVLEKCCNEMQKDSFLKNLFSTPYPECYNPHFSDISFGNSFNPSPLPLQPPPRQNPSQFIGMLQQHVHQQPPPHQNPSQFVGMSQQHVHQQPPPRQNSSQFIGMSLHIHQQPLRCQSPSQFINMLQHVYQQLLPHQNPSQFIDMSQHAHQQSEALDYNSIISQSSDNFSNLDLDDPRVEHCVTPRSFLMGIQLPNTSGNFYHPNQLCANNTDEYQNDVYQSQLATSSSSPVVPPNDQPVTRNSYTEQAGAIISSLPSHDNLVEQQMSPLNFPPPSYNELDHQSNHIDDHQSNDTDDLPDFQDYVRRFRF